MNQHNWQGNRPSSSRNNPYASYNAQPYYYSSHYAQAHLQSQYNAVITPDGYSLSLTNVPNQNYYTNTTPAPHFQGGFTLPSSSSIRNMNRYPTQDRGLGAWYEPGNCSCTHERCKFVGSRKSLEIHMMDRHLIYPPGWDNRKRKQEWDADPSLNNG